MTTIPNKPRQSQSKFHDAVPAFKRLIEQAYTCGAKDCAKATDKFDAETNAKQYTSDIEGSVRLAVIALNQTPAMPSHEELAEIVQAYLCVDCGGHTVEVRKPTGEFKYTSVALGRYRVVPIEIADAVLDLIKKKQERG